MYHFIYATYASKIWTFSNQADIVIFLSFGVARQHKTARDDLIALLPFGKSKPVGRMVNKSGRQFI